MFPLRLHIGEVFGKLVVLFQFLENMAQSSDEQAFENEVIDIKRIQVQPYMFEPGGDDVVNHKSAVGSIDEDSSSSEDEEEPDINTERLGETYW